MEFFANDKICFSPLDSEMNFDDKVSLWDEVDVSMVIMILSDQMNYCCCEI